MRVHVVTYATDAYHAYAMVLAATARRAGADTVSVRGPADLPAEFVAANASILSSRRGAGYWLWKPWALVDRLASVDDGDVVLWVDRALGIHTMRTICSCPDGLRGSKTPFSSGRVWVRTHPGHRYELLVDTRVVGSVVRVGMSPHVETGRRAELAAPSQSGLTSATRSTLPRRPFARICAGCRSVRSRSMMGSSGR